MAMELNAVLDLLTDMWAIPHSNPTAFPYLCVHQFLSGAVALLPDPQAASSFKAHKQGSRAERVHCVPIYTLQSIH
ncbi:hypothetical protein K439DRAFT_172416 [Ramaria rubella]|nr:hypothetical protein K439DRAFT_172416 [Ramaria rubella]